MRVNKGVKGLHRFLSPAKEIAGDPSGIVTVLFDIDLALAAAS